MDLVSRLKKYLDYRQISVTQFADECGIPRPTASQLLAGRNKKVSDEIISKIHQYYPTLSILWLMFGEGEMLSGMESANPNSSNPFVNANRESSLIQKGLFENRNTEKNSEFRFTNEESFEPQTQNEPKVSNPKTFEFANVDNSVPENIEETFTLKTGTGKKVVGIVVYYDDHTFESFTPDPEQRLPFLR
ncbi:MAG: XRE family transcriptional regulator [Muribaculaceae bacterium]|nr:XRE family transcriptional regulator [Muribaculaceae bacterium]